MAALKKAAALPYKNQGSWFQGWLNPLLLQVPHVDALQYIAALKARANAPEVKTFVFPEDTHALDKPQTEFEQWINAAHWMKRYV